MPPLETDGLDGAPIRRSDHLITHLTANIPRVEAFKYIKYTYRYQNQESDESFGRWIVNHDWAAVTMARGSNEKARQYEAAITGAMDRFYPTITTRRRSTDHPWINASVRAMIRKRKRIYVEEGRSQRWKRFKKKVAKIIKKRMNTYQDSQRIVLLQKLSLIHI